MKKFSNIVVKLKWPILIVVLLLTGFFGYQFKYLKVDSNIVDSLPKDDSVVRLFKEVGKEFGGNEIGMVIIKNVNVLDPEVLKHIRQVTDTLEQTDGILSVTSLTNVMNIVVKGDNFEVGQLINKNNWPRNKQEADSLRDVVVKNKLIAGNLISKDGSSTIVLFTFRDDADIDAVSKHLMKEIDQLHLPEQYYFAGSSFITKYVADVISDDLVTLIPISFLLIAFILFLSFRSVRGVVLPLLTAGLAIVWSIGTFVLLGFKLSMVSNNVPIIILAVGSAYAIHVLNRVNECKEKDSKKALVKALSVIIVPVILTALTTMIGFLSFIFGAYLTMIRDFGFLAALGTFYSALLALTFVPALMAMSPDKQKVDNKILKKNKKSLLTSYFLLPIKKLVLKYPRYILGIWIILFMVSITGIFMIKRSVSVSGYFKSNHPVSIANRIMEEKFGGSKPLFIVFKGDMQSPEVLNGMMNLEKYLNKSPYVNNTQSIADIVARLNGAMSGEEKIPDSKAMIAQLWFLLGQRQSVKQFVTDDLDKGVIITKFKDHGQNDIKKFNQYLQTYFKAHPAKDYSVEITGMPFVNARLDKSLVNSQLASLAIAIILVIAIVSLIFWSFLKGLYASLPIIATIAILYGLMGLTGIPLNVVTVLVASIAMGIGIDYSIHFISHFNHTLKKYNNVQLAVEETILISGKAITINFISVSAGFLVLVFSQLVPMIYFGILIAFSMLGSSMGALTLLPVILILENKNYKLNKKKNEN